MHISDLIRILESFLAEEGDMEVFIYDSRGENIEPKGLNVGHIARSREIEDYAYFSEEE